VSETPGASAWPRERRIALVILGACLALGLTLLLVFPPSYATYDDAKYVSLGLNILEGHGPLNDFGHVFVKHSPLWPLTLAAPRFFLGIDGIVVGHLVNGLSFLASILLTAALAWRQRPYAGALAGIAVVAFPYAHTLARTAGLDYPAIALTLAYLLVAGTALRRGSLRLGLAAGLLFAAAFLFKETILPGAPVPVAVAVASRLPWRHVARAGAATLLAAALGTSWWFVMHAQYTGVVYRLGAPAWTLLPIAVVVAVVVAVGLWVGARPASAPSSTPSSRWRAYAARLDGERGRFWLALAVVAAWTAALLVVFARTEKLGGQPLVRLAQYRAYIADWGGTLAPALLVIVPGVAVLAVLALRRRRPQPGFPAAETAASLVCAAPLVMLVVGIGETPRHYLAYLDVGLALGAIGWIAAIDAVAIWLASRRTPLLARAPRWVMPIVLVLALAGAGAIHAVRSGKVNALDPIRADVVDAAATWLRANAPGGSTIAYANTLATNLALEMRDGHRAVEIRPGVAIPDVTAPVGLRRPGLAPSDQWIAVDVALRNGTQFAAHTPASLLGSLKRAGATLLVYPVQTDEGASPFIAPLSPDHGFTELLHSTYTVGDGTQMDLYIYRVDLASLSYDTAHLYMSPAALDQLLSVLEARPSEAAAAARLLAERLVLVPDTAASAPLVNRLRVLAAP
jgi:hypothetical protein